jgi:hypothetical protein
VKAAIETRFSAEFLQNPPQLGSFRFKPLVGERRIEVRRQLQCLFFEIGFHAGCFWTSNARHSLHHAYSVVKSFARNRLFRPRESNTRQIDFSYVQCGSRKRQRQSIAIGSVEEFPTASKPVRNAGLMLDQHFSDRLRPTTNQNFD